MWLQICKRTSPNNKLRRRWMRFPGLSVQATVAMGRMARDSKTCCNLKLIDVVVSSAKSANSTHLKPLNVQVFHYVTWFPQYNASELFQSQVLPLLHDGHLPILLGAWCHLSVPLFHKVLLLGKQTEWLKHITQCIKDMLWSVLSFPQPSVENVPSC